MRIGVFDSGIGGISVLHEAMKHLPHEDFLYYADTLHVPYGPKSKEEVSTYVKQSVEQMISEEIKALVIACNTATSIAIADLRTAYNIPIIGMEPAVKPAVERTRSTGKRVLVFATELTLKQNKYKELVSRIDDQSIVDSLPLPELVVFCESLNFDREIITAYFHQKLAQFDLNAYGTVVLGCTHYPFYRELLQQVLPGHIEIIDGSIGTVKRLVRVLEAGHCFNTQGSGDITFMCSGGEPEYIRTMEQALGILCAKTITPL
ncbi:glutamate racemase [Paenibacillus sp. sgz500958]|uniref:glutamate racemase n=1 Tax=Paenibacillus sp. sgz500958 TaxID=3242475 RepID=UPI0036D3CB7A